MIIKQRKRNKQFHDALFTNLIIALSMTFHLITMIFLFRTCIDITILIGQTYILVRLDYKVL